MKSSNAEANVLTSTVTYRLHALVKLTDKITQVAYEEEIGLPAHEGRCLAAIGAASPMSIKHLSQCATLDKAQASRAAQSLVAQGLVDKMASETDGRGVVLTLTEKGQTLWHRVMSMVNRRNAEITNHLSPEDQASLDRLLNLLVVQAKTALLTQP